MRNRVLVCSALTALAVVMGGSFALTGQEANHQFWNEKEKTFTVDVALDGKTLVVNHVDPSQGPETQFRGDTLVIDGTVYPAGTLPSGTANNDPNAPGGIGKIRCRASALVPLSDLQTPAATFVTEMYSLPNDKQMIIVDGPGANLYATVRRAVLGGTQYFDGVTGEVIEQNLGVNATNVCNLRITFKLRKSHYR